MKDVKNKSKGEIIHQIKFCLKKRCLVSQSYFHCSVLFCFLNSPPEYTVSHNLSSYTLEKRNVLKVKLLIKALAKCQKQLHSIEDKPPKKLNIHL